MVTNGRGNASIYIKGEDFISKSLVKAVSVFLATLLMFATSICAFASDSADVYGLNLGNKTTEQATAIDAVSAIDSTINSKPSLELTVSDVTSSSAKLSWSGEVKFLTYTIYKFNIINNSWEEYLSTVDSSAQLSGLLEDTDYRFAIASNKSEFLGAVEFTTGVKDASVSVDKVSSSYVELSVAHSSTASEIVLYKSEDNENFTKLATLDGDTYTDTDVKEATSYYYRVQCSLTKAGKTTLSDFSESVKATTMKSYGLPAVSGTTKTYAYYTAVTAKSSPQYKLLHSDDCYTDEATGIRMVDGYYCVALGSYYGTKIGTKYRITLEGGKEINVILCDQKADRHTDANHQYAVNNQDIVEFYIEKSKLPRGIRGNFGTLEQFSGAVVAIEQYMD